jgi:hypothetical protein
MHPREPSWGVLPIKPSCVVFCFVYKINKSMRWASQPASRTMRILRKESKFR